MASDGGGYVGDSVMCCCKRQHNWMAVAVGHCCRVVTGRSEHPPPRVAALKKERQIFMVPFESTIEFEP
jgi:hypothetical protein